VLGLLVPGLGGLAVAVVASRLLPVACRALFQPTSRDAGVGGLGGFLAVRHLARRPGGVRTTMVLITAFALAGFAVAAWAVNRGNDQLIAGTEVGAPAVLTVSVPPGRDLGAQVIPEGDEAYASAATRRPDRSAPRCTATLENRASPTSRITGPSASPGSWRP
jgi:putative ABC transport system permease protein